MNGLHGKLIVTTAIALGLLGGRTNAIDLPDRTPSDDSPPVCEAPSGWRAATNGHGMFAIVYANGPGTVQVTAVTTAGAAQQTVALESTDSKAFIDFPEIYPLSVHVIFATVGRIGEQPVRCQLVRTDVERR
ncbi:hypothetical protein [Antrihabitans stalactiti]|uniref:Uncharacterized protein n=1 Tax=Antrihabitans stalactiti TaxID=2584121 RepID=A0A848K901_9NOCA|nr:hypothetical protein [Antrihabitans stalactiti]NMN94126.1 hypothetical protein [Antrihabitans stalactiti]